MLAPPPMKVGSPVAGELGVATAIGVQRPVTLRNTVRLPDPFPMESAARLARPRGTHAIGHRSPHIGHHVAEQRSHFLLHPLRRQGSPGWRHHFPCRPKAHTFGVKPLLNRLDRNVSDVHRSSSHMARAMTKQNMVTRNHPSAIHRPSHSMMACQSPEMNWPMNPMPNIRTSKPSATHGSLRSTQVRCNPRAGRRY